ncbi:MAG: hypothetical protein ABSE68_00730 [Minisyncoccia bacterium]
MNKTLEFYSKLGRPLTAVEIARLKMDKNHLSKTMEELEKSAIKKEIAGYDGFWGTQGSDFAERLQKDTLFDEKWQKLLKRAKWFRFVPFISFVLISDSMALGMVNKKSDFDALVCAREGRIFTARYFLNLVFSILRARRMDDIKGSSPDKFCFSHIITPATLKKEGLDEYGIEIWKNLVPVYGDESLIRKFFEANRDYGICPDINLLDLRFKYRRSNLITQLIERLLSGRAGDFIEQKIIKPIALKRLAKYIAGKPRKDRVIVSDEELEFHFLLTQ